MLGHCLRFARPSTIMAISSASPSSSGARPIEPLWSTAGLPLLLLATSLPRCLVAVLSRPRVIGLLPFGPRHPRRDQAFDSGFSNWIAQRRCTKAAIRN